MRARRQRREGGAAAVEAAIVTPFFLLLILGIVEFGVFFKDYLSVSSAVKAGVRIASAEPRQSQMSQDAVNALASEGAAIDKQRILELWVYKANTGDKYPSGASSFSNCTTCIKYRWNGSTFAAFYSNWPASTQVACANATADRVGVYMKVQHNAVTRLVYSSFTFEQSDVLRFEPMPSSQGCSP